MRIELMKLDKRSFYGACVEGMELFLLFSRCPHGNDDQQDYGTISMTNDEEISEHEPGGIHCDSAAGHSGDAGNHAETDKGQEEYKTHEVGLDIGAEGIGGHHGSDLTGAYDVEDAGGHLIGRDNHEEGYEGGKDENHGHGVRSLAQKDVDGGEGGHERSIGNYRRDSDHEKSIGDEAELPTILTDSQETKSHSGALSETFPGNHHEINKPLNLENHEHEDQKRYGETHGGEHNSILPPDRSYDSEKSHGSGPAAMSGREHHKDGDLTEKDIEAGDYHSQSIDHLSHHEEGHGLNADNNQNHIHGSADFDANYQASDGEHMHLDGHNHGDHTDVHDQSRIEQGHDEYEQHGGYHGDSLQDAAHLEGTGGNLMGEDDNGRDYAGENLEGHDHGKDHRVQKEIDGVNGGHEKKQGDEAGDYHGDSHEQPTHHEGGHGRNAGDLHSHNHGSSGLGTTHQGTDGEHMHIDGHSHGDHTGVNDPARIAQGHEEYEQLGREGAERHHGHNFQDADHNEGTGDFEHQDYHHEGQIPHDKSHGSDHDSILHPDSSHDVEKSHGSGPTDVFGLEHHEDGDLAGTKTEPGEYNGDSHERPTHHEQGHGSNVGDEHAHNQGPEVWDRNQQGSDGEHGHIDGHHYGESHQSDNGVPTNHQAGHGSLRGSSYEAESQVGHYGASDDHHHHDHADNHHGHADHHSEHSEEHGIHHGEQGNHGMHDNTHGIDSDKTEDGDSARKRIEAGDYLGDSHEQQTHYEGHGSNNGDKHGPEVGDMNHHGSDGEHVLIDGHNHGEFHASDYGVSAKHQVGQESLIGSSHEAQPEVGHHGVKNDHDGHHHHDHADHHHSEYLEEHGIHHQEQGNHDMHDHTYVIGSDKGDQHLLAPGKSVDIRGGDLSGPVEDGGKSSNRYGYHGYEDHYINQDAGRNRYYSGDKSTVRNYQHAGRYYGGYFGYLFHYPMHYWEFPGYYYGYYFSQHFYQPQPCEHQCIYYNFTSKC